MSDAAAQIRRLSVVLAVFFTSASGTMADEDIYERQTREDNARLAACFDAAPAEDRSARLACIGVVFDNCQNRASLSGGNYVVGCFLAEATAWETLMQRELAATLEDAKSLKQLKGAKSVHEMLADSQSAWEAHQTALCAYAYAKWGNGSMRNIDSAICARDMFAARTIFLWQERQPMPWPEDLGWHER